MEHSHRMVDRTTPAAGACGFNDDASGTKMLECRGMEWWDMNEFKGMKGDGDAMIDVYVHVISIQYE